MHINELAINLPTGRQAINNYQLKRNDLLMSKILSNMLYLLLLILHCSLSEPPCSAAFLQSQFCRQTGSQYGVHSPNPFRSGLP